MTKRRAALCGLTLLFLCVCGIGCSRDYLDPTQLGRFRPVPVVNVILDSLGVVDEPAETYAGAEDPRPEDVIPYEQDYVIGVGDVIGISIYELYAEGTPFANQYMVTETGRVSIPEVGQVRAAGLTEAKLEEEIKDILSPSILKTPSVSVMLRQSQGHVFSISGGGIGRSGRFGVPRHDFRLLDAVAQAGGVAQHNVSYIYVSRKVTGEETAIAQAEETMALQPEEQIDIAEPDKGEELSPEDEMLEIIEPYTEAEPYTGGIIIAPSEMITDEELEALAAPSGLESEAKAVVNRGRNVAEVEDLSGQRAQSGRIEWVFEDGKWLPVRVGPPQEIESSPARRRDESAEQRLPLEEQAVQRYGWEQIGTGGAQVRVIKIPVDKLLGGDARYNIVIRPGDSISIPLDMIGEFWVMGNTRGAGPINLTGRPMTLKMAIASAGGLGALAWPKKVEVVRRIGENKEVTVLVDLDKIAKGLQPDFFIKPYDLINVGTHGTARYLATLRNAFRATYGFGFIYDTNFAPPAYNRHIFPGHWSINRMLDNVFGIE
jgi:polysaccharide export outer membrane protein